MQIVKLERPQRLVTRKGIILKTSGEKCLVLNSQERFLFEVSVLGAKILIFLEKERTYGEIADFVKNEKKDEDLMAALEKFLNDALTFKVISIRNHN